MPNKKQENINEKWIENGEDVSDKDRADLMRDELDQLKEKIDLKKIEEMQMKDLESLHNFAEEYEKNLDQKESAKVKEKKEEFFGKIERDLSIFWAKLVQEGKVSPQENEVGLIHAVMNLDQKGELTKYESGLFAFLRDEFFINAKSGELKKEWDQRDMLGEIRKNVQSYQEFANDAQMQKAVRQSIAGEQVGANDKPKSATEWIKQNPIKTALIVGAGALAIYEIAKMFKQEAGAEGKSKSGFLKTIFGGLFLMGLGGVAYKNRKEFCAAAKKYLGVDIEEFFGLNKHEKFGLDKEKYDEALDLWEKGKTDEVEKIFGEDKENFKKFKEERAEKEKIKNIDGVKMTSAERAVDIYKDELGMVLADMQEWIKNHWAETAMGGYLLYKIGAFNLAINAGKNVFEVAKDLGKSLLSFGINHPFASLLIAGGSLGSGLAIYKNLNQDLPAGLGEIGNWINKKEDGAFDTLQKVAPNTDFSTLRNFSFANLGEAFGKFLLELPGKTFDAIKSRDEIETRRREADGIDNLITALENNKQKKITDLKKSSMGVDDRQKETAEVYEKYDVEKIAYLQKLIGKLLTEESYKLGDEEIAKIKNIVEGEGGELIDTDIKVTWRINKKSNWSDLCVSPKITDSEMRYDVSKRLEMGESGITAGAENVIRDFKIEVGNVGDIVRDVKEGRYGLMVEDGLAFILRNGEAVMLGPIKMFGKNGLNILEGELNWEGGLAEYGDSVVPVLITGIGMGALKTAVSLYTHGGVVLKNTPSRIWPIKLLAKPLTMPINLLNDARNMYNEVRLVRSMKEGRELNAILKKAGFTLDDALKAKNGKLGKIGKMKNGLTKGSDYLGAITKRSEVSEEKVKRLLGEAEEVLGRTKNAKDAVKKTETISKINRASFLPKEEKVSSLKKVTDKVKNAIKGKEVVKGGVSMTADKWYLLSRMKDNAKVAAELEKIIPEESLASGVSYLKIAEKMKGSNSPRVLDGMLKSGKALEVGGVSFLFKAGAVLAVAGTIFEAYEFSNLLDEYSADPNNETAKVRLENLKVKGAQLAITTLTAGGAVTAWVASGAVAVAGVTVMTVAGTASLAIMPMMYMYDKANQSRIEIRKTAEDWSREYQGREDELYHVLMGTSGTRAGDAYASVFTHDTIEDYAKSKAQTRENIMQTLVKYNLASVGFDGDADVLRGMQIMRQEFTGRYAVSSQGEVRQAMKYMTDLLAIWKTSGENWETFFADSPVKNHEKVENYLQNELGVSAEKETEEKVKKAPNETVYILNCLAESFGYTGNPNMAELKKFFSKEKAGEHGVYFDGENWRINKEGWDWDTEIGQGNNLDFKKLKDILEKDCDNIFESRYDSITEFNAANLALQRQALDMVKSINRAKEEYVQGR